MNNRLRSQCSKLLEYLAESVGISDAAYQRAEGRYKSVGDWLSRKDSSAARYNPNIYPQGSFRLGTVVRPLSESEEYDLDLVCQVDLDKHEVTQKALKILIGKEIKLYSHSSGMEEPPQEGKRCWTLNYSDSAQFHMDVLPAIPDADSFRKMLELKGYSNRWWSETIAITDMTLTNYDAISPDWLRSNPKGYAEWFKNRMKSRYDLRKAMLAESLKADIEAIPEYKVKTPLQQAVQLLKRHRDVMFEEEPENKPVSIVITTLAALSYDNEPDLFTALEALSQEMGVHLSAQSGGVWLGNPVNPTENFAERWQGHPEKKVAFDRWLARLKKDVEEASRQEDIYGFAESWKPRLGTRIVEDALKHLPSRSLVRSAQLQVPPATSSRFDVPHRERLRWPSKPSFSINLIGHVQIDGRWQSFESDCPPLPKHSDLRFWARTDAQPPFNVFWQVVNTGREAEGANGLRGSIFPAEVAGSGGLKREESTLYQGMHWIECFVVKSGVCVARSGEFVVNIA